MSVYVGFTRLLTSRLFRREREKGQKPPPARTQRVHTKEFVRPFGVPDVTLPVTNALLGQRFTKQAHFEFEQAVRREVAGFDFRRWN
jgi:hypothetical protein